MLKESQIKNNKSGTHFKIKHKVDIVVEYNRLPFGTIASRIKMLIQVPATLRFQYKFLIMSLGSNISRTWVLPLMRNPAGIAQSWFWPGIALTTSGIWGE